MVQRTVLKVHISCLKCKKELLKAVSRLQGIDKVEVDSTKGTLTVTGDVDPYQIIVRTTKIGKFVEVVSVGPPPPPPKQEAQKKSDSTKSEEKKAEAKAQSFTAHSCPICDHMGLVHIQPYHYQYQEPNMQQCSIL